MNNDAVPNAQQAAETLRSKTGVDGFDVALVMGSGWVDAADALGEADHEFAVTDLPGFTAPAVEGHAGRVRSLTVRGSSGAEKKVLVFLGRTHLYEGHGPEAVVHGVRTAIAAGVSTVVLTNAAGSLRADFQVGQPILISDHINLTGASPLNGPTFVDLTEAYDPHARDLARMADPSLAQGVYAQLRGPQYETPAEIRMLRTMGADLVGMSTALETIAAREGGARVLGISLVTNVAAGLGADPLDHEEVLEAGRASSAALGDLLTRILDHL